jgi:hypothetical protein
MKTHGDIDLTNCHPYDVFGFDEDTKGKGTPIAMMHNGILSTGNAKDTSKSDTWHYIRDYIRPLIQKDQSLIFTDAFRRLIASHISSSNKFALMDALGNVQIVNKHAGIEWNGAWFSNTYAWSARDEKIYPGISKSHPQSSYGYYGDYDYGGYTSNYSGTKSTSTSKSTGTAYGREGGRYIGGRWYSDDDLYGDWQRERDHFNDTTGRSVVAVKDGKSNVRMLPKKTAPNRGKKGRALPENRLPKPVMPVWEKNDTRASMHEKDVQYVVAMLHSISKWVAESIPRRHIEDTIAKFGVEIVDDVVAEYDKLKISLEQLKRYFANYEAMRDYVNVLYGLTNAPVSLWEEQIMAARRKIEKETKAAALRKSKKDAVEADVKPDTVTES